MMTHFSKAFRDTDISSKLNLPRLPDGVLNNQIVVELGAHVAGPVATGELARDGAAVIKIELPSGDPARNYLSPECFSSFNGGKASVVITKNDPLYLPILREATIIVDNRSESAKTNDKILQAHLKDPNKPNCVIYCSITGYPGDEKPRPAVDVTVQAASAIAAVNGLGAETPIKVGFAMLDVATAIEAVSAIKSRIIGIYSGYYRNIQNKVIPLQVSLVNVAARFLSEHFLLNKTKGIVVQRGAENPNSDAFISLFSFFKAEDGWLSIGTLSDERFAQFCHKVINRPDLAKAYPTNKVRLQNRAHIDKEVQTIIATKPRQFWLELCTLVGITCEKVNTIPQALAEPFAKYLFSVNTAGQLIIANPDGETPTMPPAPKLGGDRRAIEYLLQNHANPTASFPKVHGHYKVAKKGMPLHPIPQSSIPGNQSHADQNYTYHDTLRSSL